MPYFRSGALVHGRFVIQKLVARGGMGDVYRALDKESGESVALKLLHAEERRIAERLSAEARALIELNHPAIVRYIAHGSTGTLHFVAMEWLEGITLSDRLREGRLGFEETLTLASRAAEGLGVIHARRMIHRDIKPHNMILPSGRIDQAKIIDFGIVRRHAEQRLTTAGIAIGTPEYMAPEQLRCADDVGPPADVFALGCVLFRALTGVAAFDGENVEAVVAKIAMVEKPPRVSRHRPDVPPALDELIARMLAHSPSARPADGGAVAELVREVRPIIAGFDEAVQELRTVEPSITTREQLPAAVILVEPPQRALDPTGKSVPVVEPYADADVADLAFDSTIQVWGLGGGVTEREHVEDSRLRASVDALQVLRLPPGSREALEELRRALEPLGVEVQLLANGSLVALLSEAAAATDLAERAARCALAIHQVLPDRPIAVVTGRTILDDRDALAKLFDTAAALLQVDEPGIFLDASTHDLLSARFEVAGSAVQGFRLLGERSVGSVATEPPRLVLGRTTPCVGRSGLLRQLQALFDECVEGRAAQAVVLVAEAGLGKSRVRAEVVARILEHHPDAFVVLGTGDAIRAKVPHGVLARALRELFGIPDGPAESRWRALLGAVRRVLPADQVTRVAEFLGEMLGVLREEASPALRAARQDPVLMAEQKRAAFADWLAAESERRPVLLIVDDLHWADSASVELIGAALERMRDRPLLVVALARPEVHDQFPKLGEAWARQEIVLRPLTQAACEELVRAVLGAVDEATMRSLVTRSLGNPFYLEELLRAAAAGQERVLPDTVVASVQLRMGRLPEPARQVLRAASVFGSVFWPEGVGRLLGAEPSLHVADWLAVLEREEMIQRRRDGGSAAEAQYGFRHDLLREAAYRMLTDDDRQVGHRLAGQWLLEHGETDAVVLAEHFAGGGASEQAVDWFTKAAEAALARGQEGTEVAAAIEALRKAATYYGRAGETCAASYANQAAVGFFERAVALWSSLDPIESSRARLRLAAVRERIGQRKEALEDLAVAEAHADTPTLIELLLQRAELEVHAEEEGALERARRTAERARDLASSTGARQHEASAVLLLALSFGLEETEDSSRKAVHLAEMALRLQRGQGNLGKALWRLGNAFLTRNDLERSASLYRDAMAAAAAVQDDLLIAQCLGNLGLVEYRRWHLDAAIISTERARALFGRVGHHRGEALATHNLGVFLQYRGDLERASGLHHELLGVPGIDWRIATACQQELADQERFRGAEARAQAWLTSAVRTSERVGVPRRTAVLMGFLAESYWASGDAQAAIATLEHAAELAGMTLSHALILPQLGGHDEARPWLERLGLSEPEPDPYRRVAALLALARIRWERGEPAGGVELCDLALSILEPSPTPRFWVSVSALASSIRGEAGEAVHWLERALAETSPQAFAEAACDVGALLDQDGDPNLQRRYLACVGPVAHQGLAYRVESLRASILSQLGELDESESAREKARTLVTELSEQLQDDYRERFARHPWVATLRRIRAV